MTDTTLPDYAALAPKVLAAPTPAPVAVSPAGVPDYAALARNRAAAGVRNNMQFAPAANPDEEAQYRHLAQFIGAPLESVSADPGAARLRASLLATDADRLAAQAPTTAATLGDPSNARMLHDTIPNVVATEQTIAALGAQPQRGVWSDMGSAFASTSNKIGAAATRAELAIEPHLPKWLQSPPEDAAQLQTDVTDLNAKAAAQAPQTLPGQVVAGLTYAPFAEAAPLVVAGAEGNAREAELLGKGVDPDAARLAAASEGGLQGFIQMLPLGRLLFGAGAKPLLKSVAGATAKAGAAGAVQSVASDTATQQILAGVGTDQQTVDQYAPSIDKVLASAAFMAALHVGAQTAMGAHQGIGKPEPDNVGQTDAAQATATHGLLQKLGELATTGKFRERDSDAFRQFVSDVSDSTGAPDLYVDARQFAQTLDQAGVTVDELATKMPDVAAQMREALQSEGMVKIPLEDYAQHIAGGPVDPGLLPHLRTDPAGMSFDEAQRFYQEQAGQMTDAAGAVDKAAEKAAKQAKASELETVHDTVLDQLTATGRYTPEVSKAYAALTREFYGTTADRLGMTPAELFAKHPLRIEGADVAGEHLDQAHSLDAVKAQWDAAGLSHTLSEKNGTISLNRIVVPKEARGQGLGRAAMQQLIDYADRTGQRVELTPSADFGGTKSRLVKFYKSFGFVENKGRAKDFTTRAGMIREPQEKLAQDAKPSTFTDKTGEAHTITMKAEAFGHGATAPNSLVVRAHDASGKPTAFIDFDIRSDGVLTAANTQVKPEYRGRGLAEAMYRAARDAGYDIAPGQVQTDKGLKMVESLQAKGVINRDAIGQRFRAGDLELAQDARGTYSPESNTITALHDADLSTYLHELGHHFLETYARLAAEPDAPADIVTDVAKLLPEGVSAADWLKGSLDERRDVHENFARGFEAYLMEGKAPTVELQSLFGRFRSWLVQVYKSLSALRVQLSPEVRGVMDRMLATQTEIEQAQKVRGMESLFTTKPDGMSDADYKAYQELGNQSTEDAISDLQARGLRDMKWLSNAKSKAMRELQHQADTERAAIKEEVTKAYDEAPATQAKEALAVAEKEHDQHPTSADFNAQLIAEQHGFETVEAMHRAIDELGDRKTFIRDMTDQRMLEEHGDLVDPRSIERAAEAAVHNAARTRFIATELKGLAKAVGSAGMLAKAARAAADSAIAAKRVRDLRPDQYSAAEARAAKASAKAFMKGDTQEAAIQKRAQLLSNALARSATEAAADIAKAVEYLKKFDKASVRDKVDVAYRDQIDALLAAHDLRTSVSGKALDKRVSLKDFVEREQAAGREPMIPQDLIDAANLTHYKDMTVESFRGLVDAVKSLDHLGRLKTKILDGRDARDFKAVVDEAVAAMGTLPQRDPQTNRGLSSIDKKWLNVKAAGRSMDASLLKMEQVLDWLDNHESTGVFNRVVFRRIADAQARENDLRKEIVSKLRANADAQPKGFGNDFDKKLELPGLIDTKTGRTQVLLKRELLAAALNRGNESNWQKLLTGEKGWNEQALLKAFDDHLTKADWDYVQGIWHSINSLWPEINAMERRLGNTSPEKIAPRAFDTKHGTYEGGYYPAVYDPERSFDVERNRQRAADGPYDNDYQKATTSKGHTIERNENYARPFLLSLDVIARHVTQVIHDVSHREAINDAWRFLHDPRIQEGIEGVLGHQHYEQLGPWLQAIANDKVYDARGLAFWDKAAHWMRTTTTIVGLGYRVSTMMIHGGSAALNSVGEIGPRWMASGASAFFGTPKKMAATRDFIFERSGEMRNRMNEVDRDVRDHLREMEANSVGGLVGHAADVYNGAKRGAFYGIAMLDMASALPTWMGAYNKGLHEGMSEQDAVYAGDKAVRNAHGGTGTKDLSAIQRGPEFQKLFTMFYSFWNHFYNRQRDIARTASQLPGKIAEGDYAGARRDFGMVLARSFFYFVAPQLLHAWLKPAPPGSEQEQEGVVHWMAKEVAAGLFSGIPMANTVAASIAQKGFTVAALKDAVMTTPAAAAIVTPAKSAIDVVQAARGQPSDKWVQHAVQTAGYVFGLPTGQASNAVQYLWDVGDGKQDPQGLADWWHGLKDGHQ